MTNHFKPGSTVLVTGGAGFIGSHVVDSLIKMGCKVRAYDNLSTGFGENLAQHKSNPSFELVVADLLDFDKLNSSMEGVDFVFHLAANADLKLGTANTRRDLDQNTVATYNVLESMRKNGVREIAFSSSSAMYGEPTVFPTPETYSPVQNSLYGASKQAGEGLIQAYCSMFDFSAWVFRFVSVVGERYSHGIAYDLVQKLKADETSLQVLGDGSARKSFVYVGDLVNGVFTAINKSPGNPAATFNIGNSKYITVEEAAREIASEYGVPGVPFKHTDGKVGWKGDSHFVFLDIAKLKSLGWEPRTSIEEGLRITVRFLKSNPYLIDRHAH